MWQRGTGVGPEMTLFVVVRRNLVSTRVASQLRPFYSHRCESTAGLDVTIEANENAFMVSRRFCLTHFQRRTHPFPR